MFQIFCAHKMREARICSPLTSFTATHTYTSDHSKVMSPSQCAGITIKGARCLKLAMGGSHFCNFHKTQGQPVSSHHFSSVRRTLTQRSYRYEHASSFSSSHISHKAIYATSDARSPSSPRPTSPQQGSNHRAVPRHATRRSALPAPDASQR